MKIHYSMLMLCFMLGIVISLSFISLRTSSSGRDLSSITGLAVMNSEELQHVTRDDALVAIQQAEQDIQEMQETGFFVSSVNDTLIAAKQALKRADFAELIRENATGELAEQARVALEGLDYEGFNYADVLKYTQEITARKQQAYSLSDSVRAFELEIESYQSADEQEKDLVALAFFGQTNKQFVDSSEAEGLIKEAKTALEKERYETANSLLAQAQANLEQKQAELTTANLLVRSSKSFIEKNLTAIVIIAVLISISGAVGWRTLKRKRAQNNLEKLKREKESLRKLMKQAQTQRFEKATIPEFVYNIRMKTYQKRLNEVKGMMPVLKARLRKRK